MALTVAKPLLREFYRFNNRPNVYHISEWRLFKDWLSICATGDASYLTDFHDIHLKSLNKQILKESIDDGQRPMELFDSEWRTMIKIDYNPYTKFMSDSARESIYSLHPPETVVWFSKFPANVVDPVQIMAGIHSLVVGRHLKQARLALALFKDRISFKEMPDAYILFREVLMSGDIPLIHEYWLLGALEVDEAKEFADDACGKKGWVSKSAIRWYKEHRDLQPVAEITGRYDYLK